MQDFLPEPAQREARPEWRAVPADIILQLEKLFGEKIVHADIAWGGYSPSAAFTVTLASCQKFFLKGTHPHQDSHGTRMLRQEIGVYGSFAGIGNFSPAYRGCVSDGSEDGWMLAAFDHVETSPVLPWTAEKTEVVLQRLCQLHACGSENLSMDIPSAHEKNFVEKHLRPEGGWLRIRKEPLIREKFLTIFENEEAGRMWLSEALPLLCVQQSQAAAIGGIAGVLHQDLRSDNILFDKSGRVYFIDWPNICYGPVVLDIVGFFSSVSAESACGPEMLVALYEEISAAKIDGSSLSAALASYSGHLADNAYRNVPVKLPRLRWLQKRLLWAMLQWSVSLIGTPSPPRFKG